MSQILPSILQPIHKNSHYIHKSSSFSSFSNKFCKPIELKVKKQCQWGWSLRSGGPISIAIAAVSSSPTTVTREGGVSKKRRNKPSPAEVSRTIMELSSVGTLSVLTQEGFPLGIGVRFAVDPQQGTPILCLPPNFSFSNSSKSTLHVQLEQCGLRTPQCTIQGTLDKPQDKSLLKKLQSIWRKRFEEEVDENLIHIVATECILQTEDFMEDGVWFPSLDYKMAVPDPLRDYAESIIHEINTNNMEDIHRFCNIYVDLNFQVSGAKMIWVDRLGFDLHLTSPQNDIFEVRIPFPREVTDEKGAKSSFNCMSQLAWEMEKNYHAQDLIKVKQLKKVAGRVL